MKATVNLLVIYTNNRDLLRNEQSMFGFVFKEHQHDNGPIHDACGMTAASKIGAVIQLQSGIKLELTQSN